MKFAYFGMPHIGGTYTVFKMLRAGLREHGIEVRWIGVGPGAPDLDIEWRDEMDCGAMVDPEGRLDAEGQAAALVAEIRGGGYDGVFVNVLANQVQTNIARYLPRDVLRIMIVHNMTPGTYAAARSIRDHVHATVAVSERCRRDLTGRHGFAADRTSAIANAVSPFAHIADTRRRPGAAPRLLYLGRIEDSSKGVFWLPSLMSRLPADVQLSIAGDGPDLPALKDRFRGAGDRVRFLGKVRPQNVPAQLLGHDVFVMPSRYEGYPMSLIEAMSAGCVPVASHIDGVTDTIVDHGRDGLLFPVGDWRQAAGQIEWLGSRPDILRAMSSAARTKAASAFGVDGMARSYATLIGRLAHRTPSIAEPLDLGAWRLPAGLRPGLRTFLPRGVKNWLRVARERI
jgi:glycosyltransferase involved in cell wall biosynthesis